MRASRYRREVRGTIPSQGCTSKRSESVWDPRYQTYWKCAEEDFAFACARVEREGSGQVGSGEKTLSRISIRWRYLGRCEDVAVIALWLVLTEYGESVSPMLRYADIPRSILADITLHSHTRTRCSRFDHILNRSSAN
jgi:hypothetical protein